MMQPFARLCQAFSNDQNQTASSFRYPLHLVQDPAIFGPAFVWPWLRQFKNAVLQAFEKWSTCQRKRQPITVSKSWLPSHSRANTWSRPASCRKRGQLFERETSNRKDFFTEGNDMGTDFFLRVKNLENSKSQGCYMARILTKSKQWKWRESWNCNEIRKHLFEWGQSLSEAGYGRLLSTLDTDSTDWAAEGVWPDWRLVPD